MTEHKDDNARSAASINIAKNSVYGVYKPPTDADMPNQLTITYEQEDALETLLGAIEHNVDTLVQLHGIVLNNGGWTTDERRMLNELTPQDIRAVFSDQCQVHVEKPRPVRLQKHPNGYPLTQNKVDVIEDWFAAPENRNYTREHFMHLLNKHKRPESLDAIQDVSVSDMMIVLYVGYKLTKNEK